MTADWPATGAKGAGMRLMRWLSFGVALGMVFAPPGVAEVSTPQPLLVSCAYAEGKAPLPAEICALFLERVAARYPARRPRISPEGAAGDLRLVVLTSRARSFTARLDLGAVQGVPLSTMRADAPLDRSAYSVFFDRLLERGPQP